MKRIYEEPVLEVCVIEDTVAYENDTSGVPDNWDN